MSDILRDDEKQREIDEELKRIFEETMPRPEDNVMPPADDFDHVIPQDDFDHVIPPEEPPKIPTDQPLDDVEPPDETEIAQKVPIIDPTMCEYSSKDFIRMGRYLLRSLHHMHGNTIFYHWTKGEIPKKTVFKAPLLATFLRLMNPVITIIPTLDSLRDLGDVWYYSWVDETYKPNGMVYFSNMIKKMWEDSFKPTILQETMTNLQLDTHINREKFVLHPRFIPVKNGILELSFGYKDLYDPDSGITTVDISIIPNHPKAFVTTRIPVEYDPDATCQKIEQFIEDILPEQETEHLWLQEYIGYCLWRHWQHDIVIMLLGVGYNGKSTFIKLICEFLGRRNVTHIELYDLCHGRWYLAELYKKLANLVADIGPKELKLTSKFKTATGGDTIQGERKFKDPFWFDPFAKHIMSCNTIPYSYDDSDAFYRRWLIIQFSEQFRENDIRTDPDILDKLVTELPGFLNWALEGLKRLLINKSFTDVPSVESRRGLWNRLSNPLYAFMLSEKIVFDTEAFYPKDKFYADFHNYCVEHTIGIWTKDKVGKRMSSTFPDITSAYPAIGEEYRTKDGTPAQKQVRSWKGIRPAYEDEAEYKERRMEQREQEDARELFSEAESERKREERGEDI